MGSTKNAEDHVSAVTKEEELYNLIVWKIINNHTQNDGPIYAEPSLVLAYH